MPHIIELIDAHLAAYAEPDKARRAAAVQRIWSAEGQLIDPPMAARGHAQIVDQADALLGLYPGHRFARSTAVDEHHGFARYGWQLLDPSSHVVLEGCDFAQLGSDGRLLVVAGFFGPQPALGPAG